MSPLCTGADIELGASTPLMEASQEGHVDIVKFLIERGANVHAETSTQDTALTYASANGHTIICDILLQCGAQLVSSLCVQCTSGSDTLPSRLSPALLSCLCSSVTYYMK